jgi:Transient receptor potential (TRP) ion channel
MLLIRSIHDFPSFSFSNNFYSSYAFTSLTATLLIIDGDAASTDLGCISTEITPDLGSSFSVILTFVPLVVLVAVGIATAFAGISCPWGTTNIFKWTSNYGRDEDMLRLVTPGFGDCLQYIQFVVLTGGLTLNYPGFYQPVVSKDSWSVLMFNESFISKGNGSQSLIDGIYFTNGTYGLDILSQLVGMSSVSDIWAGMAVWLLVILGAVVVTIQIGFLLQWVYRRLSDTQGEDLRTKNMPFSVGNVIRIVFSYFLLPIVSLSMFQLVVAPYSSPSPSSPSSPSYVVALAVVMLLVVVGFAAWLLYVIASTRPKSFLFDDLPTVLLYGPLYNTYSDDAAAFALVPVLLTFVRGVAIGAVQPSGIAQVVLLAICEIITILTLHAFRPFHSPTSMNAYHTFFAVARLASILLMVAFVPSLGVTDGPKGWIGYSILLMHSIVLVFGFLLNAIQTIVEVAARLAGAGGDASGAARGGLGVFGMRQLSRRSPRAGATSRQSQLSSTAMLDSEGKPSGMLNGGRPRSQSAESAGVLLNRPRSVGLDSNGVEQMGGSSYTPTTPREASAFSFNPSVAGQPLSVQNRGPLLNLSTTETVNRYYRPPRQRRLTIEAAQSPAARSGESWTSGDLANRRWSNQDGGTPIEESLGPSISGRVTPIPAFLASQQAFDLAGIESRRAQTDYTTREVDFYYGVRGPALNANVPGRRTKTGPVDPTNPMTTAGGWLRGLFGGKTKEKGKGFEVVRSSRMPPGMARNVPDPETPPEGIPAVAQATVRNGLDSDDDEPPGPHSNAEQLIPAHDGREFESDVEGDDEEFGITRISDVPPSLPGIDIGGDIELPSRIPSKASAQSGSADYVAPSVPRKDPRRMSQRPGFMSIGTRNLGAGDFYDLEPRIPQHRNQVSADSSRLPFDRSDSKRHSTISTRSSVPALEDHSQENQSRMVDDSPTSVGRVHHHSIRTITDLNPRVDLLGSSAEIVDERRRSGSSYENA